MSEWEPYLDPDERILWEGKPSRKLFIWRKIELFFLPLSIPIAWVMITAVSIDTPIVSALMISVAGYITFGRFFISQYIRKRTTFALSTKRAFIARYATRRQMYEQTLGGVQLKTTSDSLSIGDKELAQSRSQLDIAIFHGEPVTFTFWALDDPTEPYQIARAVQRGDYACEAD